MTFEDYHGVKVRSGNAADRTTVDEIVVHDGYGARHWASTCADPTDGMIDLGSYVGDFSVLWHQLCPQSPIVCVETLAENLDCLAANVDKYAKVIYGTATYRAWKPSGAKDKVTLEDCFEYGRFRYCAMLKMDIEGFEYDVLQHAKRDTLERCRVIVGEYHGGEYEWEPGVNPKDRFRKLCQEKLPDFFLYFHPRLAHFALYSPYWWWRKECGV